MVAHLSQPGLALLLWLRAQQRSNEVAIRFKERNTWTEWTWSEYWRAAATVAANLRDHGVRRGDHVMLLALDVRPTVACLFGLWSAGAVPAPVGLPYRLDDIAVHIQWLEMIAHRLDVSVVLAPEAVARAAAGHRDRAALRVVPIEELLDGRGDQVLSEPASPAGPALLQLTSGSTGIPRAVVIPHQRLLLHMQCMSAALPSHDKSVAVSWLPLHHDMGLIGGLLFPFWNGFVAHMMAPAELRTRPLCWLETIATCRGTISAAPPSAYAVALRVAEQAQAAGLDLSSWECAMIGAEPISAALLRRFCRAFAPCGFRPEAFFPVYGLAEATVAVSFSPLLGGPQTDLIDRAALEGEGRAVPCPDDRDGLEIVSVGRAIPLTKVFIAGPEGAPLPERVVGEIWVRSETLMAGYYADLEATGAALESGWLRTGDLGYLADGELYVTGRKKEIIIRGGQNLMPAAIEEAAGEVKDIRSGCVAAVGVFDDEQQTERVVVVAETRAAPRDIESLCSRLRGALQQRGFPVDNVHLVAPGTLPKTTSGKLHRLAVRAWARAGFPASGPNAYPTPAIAPLPGESAPLAGRSPS